MLALQKIVHYLQGVVEYSWKNKWTWQNMNMAEYDYDVVEKCNAENEQGISLKMLS